MSHLLLLALVLAPLLGGAVALVVERRAGPATIAGGATSTLAAAALLLVGPHAVAVTVGRLEVGVEIDRVTALLALTTAAIGTTVLVFSDRALATEPHRARFLACSALLIAATATVTVAASLPLLAIGWLGVSWLVVALVRRPGAAAAARRIRRAQAVGDLAIVGAAVATLAADQGALGPVGTAATWSVGSLQLAAVDVVAVLLIVAGIARSALVPLHGWLGASLAGPTPLSALLHAGVVNGIGVLVIRTAPTVGASDVAVWLLFAAGAGTAVLATSMMLVRADVKGALAWSTAGQMGFMAVQLAVGAFAAALFHIVGHAWFKAAAFLGAAGSVDTGTAASHLPRPGRAVHPLVRVTVAGALPAGAIAATFALVDPHGTDAGLAILAIFGWFAAARLVDGWLRGTGPAASGLATASVAAVVLPAAYVAAVAGFERRFEPALLERGGDAVSGVGLVPLLVALAVAAAIPAVLRFAPGTVGRRLRRRALALLVGWGTPPVAARRTEPAVDGVRATVPVPAANHT